MPILPPPTRDGLIALFDRVAFNPLSISVLSRELKTRRETELGESLEQLFVGSSGVEVAPAAAQRPSALLTFIKKCLDQFDEDTLAMLTRLGVFQGGAMENELLNISGLGDSGERRRIEGILADIEAGKTAELFKAKGQTPPDESQVLQLVADKRRELAHLPSAAPDLWPTLRRQLEAVALIEAENIPDVQFPFIRFHPILALFLWTKLTVGDRIRLSATYRLRYSALAGYLNYEYQRNPFKVRAIFSRELPNLLHGALGALESRDPNALVFAADVNALLLSAGLKKDAERLAAKRAIAVAQEPYFAQFNRGRQLRDAGRPDEAAKVYESILQELGDAITLDRAKALGALGECFYASSRPDLAAHAAQEAIAICEKLEQTSVVKWLKGFFLFGLSAALTEAGWHEKARQVCLLGLKIDRELGDRQGEVARLGELGSIAMKQGSFKEAAEMHASARDRYRQLREPANEAAAWHLLGCVALEQKNWNEAESCVREAARIKQDLNDFVGAARSWQVLAIASKNAGRLEAAEYWYRQILNSPQTTGFEKERALAMSNLANLLQAYPARLAEARALAEDALAIKRKLDPNAAAIWDTYDILAEILTKEMANTSDKGLMDGFRAELRKSRRLAREARNASPEAKHQLRKYMDLIAATLAACEGEPQAREFLSKQQMAMRKGASQWVTLANVLDRILAGERDEAALCQDSGSELSMIIETILRVLSDPSTLTGVLGKNPSGI